MPYWCSVPTIVAANSNQAGTKIEQLFFVTDDKDQENRSTIIEVVSNWYEAYVDQNINQFMAALANNLEAYSYNLYESSKAVSKKDYHNGLIKWSKANIKGGYEITDIVVHGQYVAVVVQFCTIAKATCQQKMTNEVHMIKLNSDLQIERAYFYETNLCGNPALPCSW